MHTQFQKSIKALELDKVLALVADEAGCMESRERLVQLIPAADYDDAARLLVQTNEALLLICRYGTPTIVNVHNPGGACKRAQMGGSLSAKELLRVGEALRVIRGLAQWGEKAAGGNSPLADLFSFLFPNAHLEERIMTSILDEDNIADAASGALTDIRRKIRAAGAQARSQLDGLIRSTTHQKHLQEQIITIRDGRFVVPVKAEYRSEIKGLVHDTSSSGATLFVEPVAVVEANNKIKLLEIEEQREIDRILAELSGEVGAYARELMDSYESLLELDCIFAKARYADRTGASLPVLARDGRIELKKARHPLIDRKKVVPIDISLGGPFDTLVITGPNTGGKTVSLKTLGLLSLMAMSGLLLPCDAGSVMSVFDQVLADIGDEQSIEQSLSTFSAHMKQIISILQGCGENSLVLLDELGSGTDPIEGAALAVAILEALRLRGCIIAATTHYAELKVFALETSGVENGCCEFDINTLSPTYRLLIGVPGRSNAFAIAKRLGLDETVVEAAKQKLSLQDKRFEDVVSSLEESRVMAEQERSVSASLRMETERLKAEIERKEHLLEQNREKEMERARIEAKRLVSELTAQADALLGELDALRRQKDRADFGELTQKVRAQARAVLREMDDKADPVQKKKTVPAHSRPRALKTGDEVRIASLGAKGYVLEPVDHAGNILVQAGIIKTRVPVEELELVEEQKPRQKKVSTISTQRASSSAATEISLRGMNAEEALMELDRFIDQCVMNHIYTVRIVHGKGTGVLRQAVGRHLKQHKCIKSFRLGVYGEGEDGVTIAELK